MADPNNLSSVDFDLADDSPDLNAPRPAWGNNEPISPYRLPASEQLRGVANRIIFSRYYIVFYFVMMTLSLATVVLSLIATSQHECPPPVWHILEVIVNTLMVLEVSTRWVAYGKKYPMTILNMIDLVLVFFCVVTLIFVFASPCGEGTRQEEFLDTILLVIRNGVQFLRLGHILRRSGHSLFNPPRPMDLSQARSASMGMDFDVDDEEAVAEHALRSGHFGGGYQPVYVDEPARDDVEEDRAAWSRS
ncbi:hypothetical protein CspeluHIS016_0107780 [Cutaneotrichosporon spelunceum]|uniref:Ion transport domain-containing protein n=1 Tax=Cutaneotrichosporon spelunceum TaxID=1672016 RepID=A0AAD3TPM2_9TREE|nr:hypothetical protein CspeluHIS016_0107780 [Cutaneotrichosporon spelunceum]